jgi:hypothetical protein
LGADAGGSHEISASASGIESWAAPAGYLACLGGTLVTMFALRRRRIKSAGLAERAFIASLIALIGLLALHLGNPRDPLVLEAYCAGCFLGMSTPEGLKGWFEPLLGALMLTALLVAVRAHFPGVGGGLGFVAFVSVALLAALSRAAAGSWIAMMRLWTKRGVSPRTFAK